MRPYNTSIPNTDNSNKNYGIQKFRKLHLKQGLQSLQMLKCIAGPPFAANSAPPFLFVLAGQVL